MEHSRTETLENHHVSLKLGSKCLGNLNTAANNHNIYIRTLTTQVVVAHITSDNKGLHTTTINKARDLLEYW